MFLNIQTALRQATELFEKARVPAPRLTAEVLLAHAVRRERSYLYAHLDDPLTELAWIHFGRYLNDRLNGKPTQYITGRQEFFGRDYYVDGRVLIPRPETEHLVEAALSYAQARSVARVIEVGTGSGAIAISFALERGMPVLASDLSLDALTVAGRNRDALQAPVHFFAGDLLDCVAPSSCDLLLSNPPYVPGGDAANMQAEVRDWEPHVALFAAADGLSIYQRLIPDAARVLRPGGCLMMELGYQSLAGVREILAGEWLDIDVVSDLAGWPRVMAATRR